MSHEEAKIKHSRRIQKKEDAVKKQVKIAKAHGATQFEVLVNEPHRFHKHHAMNCGNPKCVMCGNPRRTFKEKTYQEKKQQQDVINNDMG